MKHRFFDSSKLIVRKILRNIYLLILNFLFCVQFTNELTAQTIEVISVTPSKNPVLTGEDYVYSIQYRCAGITGNCNGQSITSVIPAEIAHNVILFGDAFTSSTNYDAVSRTATWNIGSLATGTTGQVSLSLRFRDNFTPNNTTATLTVNGVNSPVVTANTDPKFEVQKNGPNSVGTDGTITYFLGIKNTTNNGSSRGGVFADNVTLTDTWPAGGVYVAHTQNSTFPAPIILGNSITFSPGTMSSGDQTGFSVTIQYPIGSFPEGTNILNEAEGKGTPRGSSEIISNKATVSSQVQAARCDVRIGFRGDNTSPNISPGYNTYSNYGWGNRVAIDMGNASNVPASVDVVHDIPLAFSPIKLDFYNNSSSGGILFFYKTNLNNSSWIPYSGNPLVNVGFTGANVDVSFLGLASGEYLTQIRARSSSQIPAGGGISMNYHYDFSGVDRNGTQVTGDVPLKLRYKATCDPGGLGSDPVYDPEFELMIILKPPYTEISLGKYVNPGAVTPGGIGTYTLRWDINETGSSAPPINPIVTDFLPLGLDYVDGSARDYNNNPFNPSLVTEEVIRNYNGTGRTLVRWKFSGIYGSNANNGKELIIFQAKVLPGTPVGVVENIYNVSSNDSNISSTFRWPNSGKEIIDVNDLDGDGSTTDILVTSEKASVNILELASLESYKWVKGSLDASENRYPNSGKTTRGGMADYRLIVRNLGNITMKDVIVYDILPFIGDKAVIGTQDRLTAWRPNLLSTVSFVPNNPNIKVYYSQQTNPCRPEVYAAAGCVDDWSLTPPSDLATVQALKFDFGTLNISGGDSIQLSWQMKAPVDAPAAGEIAWNSFAYSTTRADNSVVLAPSEPVKVGISVEPPPPSASVGDYVFKDLNNDNIQNGSEVGINVVKVEIFKSDGTAVTDVLGAPVSATYTSNNSSGQPGSYSFVLLPPGSYKIVFTNPDPSNCVIQSGANTTTGETAVFILANNENKTDVDLILGPAAPPCSLTLMCTPQPQTSCTPVNGSATVTTSNALGTVTYLWSSNETTNSISNKVAGTYTVTVTDGGLTGCTATCQAVIVSAVTLPTAQCSATNNSNCTTPNGTATVTTNGNQIAWSTGANAATITGLSNGTYTVTVTDTGTGCTNTCTAQVQTTTTLPTAQCSATNNSNCTTPNGTATVTTNGNQIAWSTGATTANITGLSAGTYTVTVTNTATGCTNTCQAVVINSTVNPTCNITANTQPSCGNLTGGDITVVPNPAGTYTYAWSDNGAVTANRTGLTGGTYTVTVTNTITNCTGVCNVTLTTPTNCCNIAAIVPQNIECIDNGTPALITDNRIRFNAMVTNTNTSLTEYNVTINGGTTITPNMNVPYGVTQFTLGVGTAGGGATFTVTVTDNTTPGCTQTVQIIDPGGCNNTTPCPTPKCGTATIQVNGN